jgi:hypothetical protein
MTFSLTESLSVHYRAYFRYQKMLIQDRSYMFRPCTFSIIRLNMRTYRIYSVVRMPYVRKVNTLFILSRYIFTLSLVMIVGEAAVPLQAWSGTEGSRKLRFPDYMTTAQDGGKVVSLTNRPHLPPGNSPGTHFC